MVVGAGDGYVPFYQVICEFPLLPPHFSFVYTSMSLALLLFPAAVFSVAASCPLCHGCFNNAVRKLHQKEIKREKFYFW